MGSVRSVRVRVKRLCWICAGGVRLRVRARASVRARARARVRVMVRVRVRVWVRVIVRRVASSGRRWLTLESSSITGNGWG